MELNTNVSIPTTHDESARLISMYRLTRTILSVYYVSLVFIALTCNPLSFIILSRKAFAKTNMSIFLRSLAIFDTMALLCTPVHQLVSQIFDVHIMEYDAVCFIILTGDALGTFAGRWVLVAMTFERVIAILKPHKIHLICSRRKAKISTLATTVIPVLVCIVNMYTMQDTPVFNPMTNSTFVIHCRPVGMPDEFYLFSSIFYNTFWTMLPLSLLVVMSLIIVIAMRSNTQKMAAKMDKSSSNIDGSNPTDSNAQAAKSYQRQSKDLSVTKTLLSINFSFLICTFPLALMYLTPILREVKFGVYLEMFKTLELGLTALSMTHHANNFFLYCITGTRFRKELVLFFRSSKK